MNLLNVSGLWLSAHHLVNTMIYIPRLVVGLLVDVFESFRISASKAYGLDPAHVLHLAWVKQRRKQWYSDHMLD
jgi:hypothetical protein